MRETRGRLLNYKVEYIAAKFVKMTRRWPKANVNSSDAKKKKKRK